jgi:hypothetical protein
MRLLLRSATVALVLSGALAGAAQANVKAGSVSVTKGAVKATLSWQAGGADNVEPGARLTIVRNGQTLLDKADLSKLCMLCGTLAEPRKSLHVRDLDGDGEPEVLVDFWTGGAHCCSSTGIYYLKSSSTDTYGHRVATWGNAFYKLTDLDGDGKLELVSGDDRFAYEFTAFAFSWDPPLVYDFVGDRLVDRTRSFPAVVNADLKAIAKQLKVGRKQQGDLRGLVAADVADLYLLGRGSEVDAYLASELKKGDLGGDSAWASGKKFKPALLKFLRKTGYVT